MMQQPTLSDRVARCRRHADAGEPVICIVPSSEVEAARQLCGTSPVIICDGNDARRFLEFMSRKPGKKKPR
jgi:hypothetical protein